MSSENASRTSANSSRTAAAAASMDIDVEGNGGGAGAGGRARATGWVRKADAVDAVRGNCEAAAPRPSTMFDAVNRRVKPEAGTGARDVAGGGSGLGARTGCLKNGDAMALGVMATRPLGNNPPPTELCVRGG